MSSFIDRALEKVGLFRSVDNAYALAMERVDRNIVLADLNFFPNCMNALARIYAVHAIPECTIVSMIGSGIFAFVYDDKLHIDFRLERLADNEETATCGHAAIEFALAHELGHIHYGHSNELVSLTKKTVKPGWTTIWRLDDARIQLQGTRRAISHRQEREADEYATKIMQRMGYKFDEVRQAFDMFGENDESDTHPSYDARVAHIKQVFESNLLTPN